LDKKLGNNKVWIDGLVHQIQLMTHGSGVFTFPFPIETFLNFLKEIHNLCLSQTVQSVGSMHVKILLLHHVDALTTYFVWLYIWRAKPLFVLVPFVGSFCP
jgi:hypothetical protein